MVIRVMSAQDINNYYPGTIAALHDVLDGRPGADVPLDLVRVFSDATDFGPPLEGVIALGNGSAYWSLSREWLDDLSPTPFIQHSALGLTGDGKYYIQAMFLTAYKDASIFAPPTYNQDDPDLVNIIRTFHQSIFDAIAAAPDSDFTPSPSQIHALLSSLTVDPGTFEEIITEVDILAAGLASDPISVSTLLPAPTSCPSPPLRPVPTSIPVSTLLPTLTIEASLQGPLISETPAPTSTAVPLLTPTPLPLYCSAAPPSRIQVGERARVTISAAGEIREDLRVRSTAGGERIGSMAEGTIFRVIGGYECINDLTWWQVETLDQAMRGWVSEGVAPDDYYIEPVSN